MDKEDFQEKFDRARTAATENVKRATASLKEGTEQLGERARAASAGAGETFDKVKEQAGKAAGQANRIITEHPLAAAAAAVAVGATLAYIFPKSSKKLRNGAPKLLAAASAAGQTLAEQAKSTIKAPVAGADTLLEKIGGAARKAPGSAADIARSGLESARSGIETARNFAADTAKKADLEEKAGKLLEAASEVATKMASRVRDHSRRDAD